MAASAASPLLMRIVSASVAVSHRAGRIIRNVLQRGELGIVEKGKNDLQTEADRSAQRCIVASLHRQFPKVAIYGEEQLDPAEKIDDDFIELGISEEVLKENCPDDLKDVNDDEIVIWVDPLDGTAEFTQAFARKSMLSRDKPVVAGGLHHPEHVTFPLDNLISKGLLDHVTVLIGIAVNGKARGGVVYQPYHNYLAGPDAELGRCIWGVVGLGTYGIKQEFPPASENIITTTRSHSNRCVTEAVEACEPTKIVRVGGAGHKVLLLLEGRAHAYVFASNGCKKWDTCAPEAVLHGVGGTLTDLNGKQILYHKDVKKRNDGGVLATVADHKWYVNRIPEDIKEIFKAESQSQTTKL